MLRNHRDALEVPLKRKIRWTLIIVVLFFAGLLVDYMFLHLVFKQKNLSGVSSAQEIPPPPEIASISVQNAVGEIEEDTKVPEAVLQKFQSEIAKCFGTESPVSQSTSTDRFVHELLAMNESVRSTFEVENIHVRLKDGTLRRLHLIQADPSSGKNVKELRYFSLDSEGMPVKIPLPDDKRMNPSPEFIDSLKSEGTLVFHQLKEKRTLKDGSELSLNVINNHVFEFQLFGKEKSFFCRELECQCR